MGNGHGSSMCHPGEGIISGRRRYEKKDSRVQSLRSQLFKDHPRNVNVLDHYKIVRLIGQGSVSTIHLIRRKEVDTNASSSVRSSAAGWHWKWFRHAPTFVLSEGDDGLDHRSVLSRDLSNHPGEDLFALKAIMKDQMNEIILEEMRNEISILKSMDHPNIVRVYERFEYKRELFIVMEYCSGGDLYEREPYDEDEAAKITYKLISAVAYMHKNNVVHRDIKFENIMFENDSPEAEVKVIDFGLSKKSLGRKQQMTEMVGTVYTMSPQVIQGVYTSQADVWSCGVVAFMLLSGEKPFWGKKREQIIDKIMRCAYSFDGPNWANVSLEAKSFVSSLLKMDPWRRPTARSAMRYQWFRKTQNVRGHEPRPSMMNLAASNLTRYARDENKLKKIALLAIAHKSSMEEITKLRNVFNEYDRGNDGVISFNEFKAALEKTRNMSHEEIEDLFEKLDIRGTGEIDYTEFLAATLEAQGHIERRKLAEAFDRWDSEGNGFISQEQLKKILGPHATDETVQEVLQQVDADCDGRISYEDFLSVFKEKQETEIQRRATHIYKLSAQDDLCELLDENAVIPGGRHELERDLNLSLPPMSSPSAVFLSP